MKPIIRPAKENDLESIFKVEKRSYPYELQAPHRVLRDRLNSFGIKIAELDGEVVGFYTCVPVFLDWKDESELIRKIRQNRDPYYTRWFNEYKNSKIFNTLYITSTAVSSEHQGKGIGKLLVKHSLDLAKEQELDYRASVLRVKGYGKFAKKGLSIGDYLDGIKTGKIVNPILNHYLSLEFTLGKPISNYEPDRSSMNYGIFAHKKIGDKDGG